AHRRWRARRSAARAPFLLELPVQPRSNERLARRRTRMASDSALPRRELRGFDPPPATATVLRGPPGRSAGMVPAHRETVMQAPDTAASLHSRGLDTMPGGGI